MRTLRRFYTGLTFSALILASSCTTSDSADTDDDFAAADAGNQIVDVRKDEITDSEIPDPEQIAVEAEQAAEAAGESIDGNSPNAISDLSQEQQAAEKGPELPEDQSEEPGDYQIAQDNKSAQPVSDIEPAAAQTDSLPSLAQVVAESDSPAPLAADTYGSEQNTDLLGTNDAIAPSGDTAMSAGVDADKPKKARKNKVRKSRSHQSTGQLSGPYYIVQPGDTLGKISLIVFGSTHRWQDLASANGLDSKSRIYPGDVILYSADDLSAEFETAYANLPRSKAFVQKGDTLESIAERRLGNKAYWKLLWRWNQSTIPEPNKIFVGQGLDYIAPEALGALHSDRQGLKSAH